MAKKKQVLKISIYHPDPKKQKEGEEAMMGLIKAVGELTGEKIEVRSLSNE